MTRGPQGWIEDAIYKAKPAGVASSQTAAFVICKLWTDVSDDLASYLGRRNATYLIRLFRAGALDADPDMIQSIRTCYYIGPG